MDKFAESLDDADRNAVELAQRVFWIYRLLSERLDLIALEYGLAHAGDHEVLALVLASPDGLTQTDLANALRLSKSGVSGAVDRLEADGLIRRQVDANDRRSFRLEITAAGSQLVNQNLAVRIDVYQQTLTDLTAGQRQQLLKLLEKVHARASSLSVDG